MNKQIYDRTKNKEAESIQTKHYTKTQSEKWVSVCVRAKPNLYKYKSNKRYECVFLFASE